MLKKTIGMGGFTLAEVLITLGIIGVVAAMTMPTLINSTQGAQYKTAFKKSLTVLSQAVVMNIALNDYDLSQVVAGQNNYDSETPPDMGAQTLYDLFDKRLNIVRRANTNEFDGEAGDADAWIIVSNTDADDISGFLTGDGTAGKGGISADVFKAMPNNATISSLDMTALFMNDGITFIFDNTQSDCHEADDGIGLGANKYCFGYIDVNGQKAPNRVVQCDTDTLEDEGEPDATCTVSNPTDIYPIAMFNQSVIPASAAARAVLYNK